MSALLLPLFLLGCLAAGAARRVPLYDAFVEGAREARRGGDFTGGRLYELGARS